MVNFFEYRVKTNDCSHDKFNEMHNFHTLSQDCKLNGGSSIEGDKKCLQNLFNTIEA
jgi:hypothetical protein